MSGSTGRIENEGTGGGAAEDDNGEKIPKRTNVLLENGIEYMVHSWKVKTGDVVRAGETIALICSKGSKASTVTNGNPLSSSSSASSSSSSSSSSTALKRPSRRRRMSPKAAIAAAKAKGAAAAAAASAASVSSTSSSPSTNNNKNTGAASRLQHMLGKKLGTIDTDAPKKNQSAAATTATSSDDQIKQTSSQTPAASPVSSASSDDTVTSKKDSPNVANGSLNMKIQLKSILATEDGIFHMQQPPMKLHASPGGDNKLQQPAPQQQTFIIGYIEECLHPAFLDGLCVVCGKQSSEEEKKRKEDDSTALLHSSVAAAAAAAEATAIAQQKQKQERDGRQNGVDDDDDVEYMYSRSSSTLFSNSFSARKNPSSNSGGGVSSSSSSSSTSNNLSQVTVAGGITMKVSEQEGRQMAMQDSARLLKQKKLSLVLDLDHTLVHATSDPRAAQYRHQGPSTTINTDANTIMTNDVRTLRLPMFEGMPANQLHQTQQQHQQQQHMWMQHFVKLRPYIKEFLQTVQPMYELTVYTAGTRQYAEEITIVLCRHLLDCNRDLDDIESLRYQVHVAQSEYYKHQEKLKNVQEEGGKGNGNDEARTEKNEYDTNKDSQDKESTNNTDDGNDDECSDDNKKRSLDQVDSEAKHSNKNDTKGATTSDEQSSDPSSSTTSSPPKKRRKKIVSFGFPDEPEDSTNADDTINGVVVDGSPDEKTKKKKATLRSDHVTLQQLHQLKDELMQAEKLERQARELKQKLFGSRVVSRTDVGDLGRDVKSLKRIFPCGGTMAAVIDDREDVWANASDNSSDTIKGEPPDNLLLVRPYHWQPFLGFADINNSSGKDWSTSSDNNGEKNNKVEEGGNQTDTNNRRDKENDIQLQWTSTILKELHKRYYEQEGILNDNTLNNLQQRRQKRRIHKTVPEILNEMRFNVLKGCKVVLSGLVPLHHKKNFNMGMGNRARPSIVRYAQTLGAMVSEHVQPGITHVVAAKDGTDKALAARRIQGCVLVKAAWLVECYWSLSKRDVTPHYLGKQGPSVTGATVASSREGGALPSSSSSPSIEQQHEQRGQNDDISIPQQTSSPSSSTSTNPLRARFEKVYSGKYKASLGTDNDDNVTKTNSTNSSTNSSINNNASTTTNAAEGRDGMGSKNHAIVIKGDSDDEDSDDDDDFAAEFEKEMMDSSSS